MPNFKPINDIEQLEANCKIDNRWKTDENYQNKKILVDSKGNRVSTTYSGRKYLLIHKQEREFGKTEEVCRVILGIVAVFFSIGLLALCKPVQNLLCKGKEKFRIGLLVIPSEPKAKEDSDDIFEEDVVRNKSKPSKIKSYVGDSGFLEKPVYRRMEQTVESSKVEKKNVESSDDDDHYYLRVQEENSKKEEEKNCYMQNAYDEEQGKKQEVEKKSMNSNDEEAPYNIQRSKEEEEAYYCYVEAEKSRKKREEEEYYYYMQNIYAYEEAERQKEEAERKRH